MSTDATQCKRKLFVTYDHASQKRELKVLSYTTGYSIVIDFECYIDNGFAICDLRMDVTFGSHSKFDLPKYKRCST